MVMTNIFIKSGERGGEWKGKGMEAGREGKRGCGNGRQADRLYSSYYSFSVPGLDGGLLYFQNCVNDTKEKLSYCHTTIPYPLPYPQAQVERCRCTVHRSFFWRIVCAGFANNLPTKLVFHLLLLV